MTEPDLSGSGPRARNDMRVTAGDFISWDTWCGRTTAYVLIGNDNHHYGDSCVSLRAADHHDEFFEWVPAGADWATVQEVADFIESSRSRWADGHPAVPESAVDDWRAKLALRSSAQSQAAPGAPFRRLDRRPSDPPGHGL